MDFFLTLLIAFVLAFVFGKVAHSFGLARVVGYIAAGLLLTHPFFSLSLFDTAVKESFESIANFGLLLLFFFSGLEVSIPAFKRNLRESLFISALNTALPFIIVFWFTTWMGFSFTAAVVIGLIMSVSAQAVIVDVLDELGLLKDRLGQLIVNAGSVDDIVELLLLTLTLGLIGFSSSTAPFQFLFNLVIFVALVVSAKLWIVPSFFSVFSTKKSPESLFGASLAVALLMGVLSNMLGLGVVIGAVISGIIVRNLLSIEQRKPWEEHKISNDIHLIGFGFFIPLFFVWVGYNTDLGVTLSNPFLIVLLFLISFFFGIFGTWLGVRLNKGSHLEGLLVALAMSTKGDVELAVGLIALKAGFISNEIFSAVVVIALISSILPPILFKHFIQKYLDKKNPFYSMPNATA
ncbi:MAG: cation:proton antiporter [archaeon]|nr:cation:proton antiporter [archaeon]